MSAHADYGCFLLQQPGNGEQLVAKLLICPSIGKVRQHPAWSFDAEDIDRVKSAFIEFFGEVGRTMEVGGDEVAGVSCVVTVLAIGDRPMPDVDDMLVESRIERHSVERPSIPADGRAGHHAAWTKD